LSIALTRPLPASHQHGHFVVATHKRREIALRRAASAAAYAYQLEQNRRLGHAPQRVGPVLFGNEEAGDLALHSRRDQNRAGFG
jgi:hypothetical protein